MVTFRLLELKNNEVININDGTRLGFVTDIEFDDLGKIKSLIIPGSPKFLGIFGRGSEICIPWENVEKVGNDLIIVKI